MSVTESRRESLVTSEKRQSVASVQQVNGYDVGSRRASTHVPSIIPSATASRRGSIVSKVASVSSVQKPDTSTSKLPPRPWDYDDYYYQDDDGNWRNEYDDEGYEFDPDVYEDEEEYYKDSESRRMSLALSEKRKSVTSLKQVNGADMGSRRPSAVMTPAIPSAIASRRGSTVSRSSVPSVVPPPQVLMM